MAATSLQDVIIPEVFADYVVTKTAELSKFYEAGVATSDPVIAAKAAGGGDFVNLPYFNDLTGDDEVVGDTTDLTLNALTASSDVAVKCFRGKAWSSVDLVAQLAGANPIQALGNRVAAYWARKEQASMIATLTGCFAGPLAATHVLDISTETGDAAKISASVVLDAKNLLGDNAEYLSAIVMHSAIYTALQKQQLIVFTPPSAAQVSFPTYLGYRVIIDDMVPADTGVYTSYLLAAGALVHQEIPQPNAIETQRIATKGQDILVSRSAYITHLRGCKWALTTGNPANAVLADHASWTKVYADKQIRAIALVTK